MERRYYRGLRKLLRDRRNIMMNREKIFKEYVRKISLNFPKSTIVLFGSRAKGEERPDSDYDLLIIMENDDKLSRIIEIRKLKPRGIETDILVLSPQEILDPIYREMLRNCRVLYDGLGLDHVIKRITSE